MSVDLRKLQVTWQRTCSLLRKQGFPENIEVAERQIRLLSRIVDEIGYLHYLMVIDV